MDTGRSAVRTKANPSGGRHLESPPTGTHRRYDNRRNAPTSLNQAHLPLDDPIRTAATPSQLVAANAGSAAGRLTRHTIQIGNSVTTP